MDISFIIRLQKIVPSVLLTDSLSLLLAMMKQAAKLERPAWQGLRVTLAKEPRISVQ